MAPPVNFPGSGPDQSLFFTLFGLAVVFAVLGYMTGSKTLRLVAIMLFFAATAIFLSDVFTVGTVASGLSSVFAPVRGSRPLPCAAADGPRAHRWRVE